ncbi:coil containing protein [Vibrio phage 2.275.O._10N.286.54.E11]|nr:coil containing protein [Vibrio phage 2.275.O._10N.286.54.E11]
MSQITRHRGVVEATGSRCIVVFRELPDQPDKALICYSDSIPEMYATSLARVVDGNGQGTKDLYEVLTREFTPDGGDFLTTLHNMGKLHTIDANKVQMQVTPSYNIRLDQLNAQIRGDDTPANDSNPDDLQKKLNPYKQQNEAEADINASGIAERLLMEADDFQQEADRKRNRAYELRPELKPAEPLISSEEIAALESQAVIEVAEVKEVSPTEFTIELEGVSQRKAIQELQEAWRAINKKDDKSTDEDSKE